MEEEAGVYHGMPNNLEEDAASGVPIPDIFILGALIIQCTTNGSTMYGVCVYHKYFTGLDGILWVVL